MDMCLALLVVLCLFNGLEATDCPSEPESRPDSFIFNGCVSGSASDCVYVVRIGPNPDNNSYVEFYLEATTKGYTAVGFSKDKRMPSTDVLGCGRNAEGALHVRDTWNPSYYNEDDPDQDGVCVHSMSYEDNVIKCSFSRYAAVINVGYDFDLNDTYYLLLAYFDNQDSDNNFPQHSLVNLPRITDNSVNVYVDNGNSSVSTSDEKLRMLLIRIHGILMTVAWPFLAVIGIFFSAWTKPAFPTGQWFQFHRALMISSVVVALIAFILVFVANKDNSIPGLVVFTCDRKISHMVIGIVVTAFQLLNPLIALCRPKPDSNHRVIFNIVHGSGIGFITELLALVNIGLGIALFQSNCSKLSSGNHILWTYLSWIAFLLVLQITLFCIFTATSFSNHDASLAPTLLQPFLKPYLNREKNILERSNNITLLDDSKEKLFMKDSNIRSAALGIFCVVTFIFMAILIVMLAVEEEYAYA